MAAQIRLFVEMLEPILQDEPEMAEEKRAVRRVSGSIELSQISFRYVNSSLIMDKVSLKI